MEERTRSFLHAQDAALVDSMRVLSTFFFAPVCTERLVDGVVSSVIAAKRCLKRAISMGPSQPQSPIQECTLLYSTLKARTSNTMHFLLFSSEIVLTRINKMFRTMRFI